MIDLTYLTSSSFSGSTLFTFLVNQHPEAFTIGELEGWDYATGQGFPCSCGDDIEHCCFFSEIAKAYQQNNIVYNPRNFGTRFKLSNNENLNRYLTQDLPLFSSSKLENIRDNLLWSLPGFSTRFKDASIRNKIFVQQALDYSRAKVFVDTSKNPFRLRHLKRTNSFNINVIYLVRDLRGQVLSTIKKKPVTVEMATQMWIKDQVNICRILDEFKDFRLLYYEELCSNTEASMNILFEEMGLKTIVFSDIYRKGEHHILGNSMRITNTSKIKLDEKWKFELSAEDLKNIEKVAHNYTNKNKVSYVTKLINHYLG